MYQRTPDDNEFAFLGMKAEDFAPPTVAVWPENRNAVLVFLSMRTQWRLSMAGYTGLDYSALPEMWRRCKVPPDDRDQVFRDLQLLENTALLAMREE